MDIEEIRKAATAKKKMERPQVNVRLEPEVYKAYKAYCTEHGINGSEAIRLLIKELIGWKDP